MCMLRAAFAGSHGEAQDHGDGNPPIAHIVHFGSLVDYLIHTAEDEVAILHFGDWPHSGHCGADGRPDDCGLRNRRIHHAIMAELFGQSQGDRKAAAKTARYAEVFPQQEYARVLFHCDAQSFTQRFRDSHPATTHTLPFSRRRHARNTCREPGLALIGQIERLFRPLLGIPARFG